MKENLNRKINKKNIEANAILLEMELDGKKERISVPITYNWNSKISVPITVEQKVSMNNERIVKNLRLMAIPGEKISHSIQVEYLKPLYSNDDLFGDAIYRRILKRKIYKVVLDVIKRKLTNLDVMREDDLKVILKSS